MLPGFNAVIFDLDGTLADSAPDIAAAPGSGFASVRLGRHSSAGARFETGASDVA